MKNRKGASKSRMRSVNQVARKQGVYIFSAVALLGGLWGAKVKSLAATVGGDPWVGISMAQQTVRVSPPESGILVANFFEEGERVEKGQVLGRMDSRLERIRERRLGRIALSEVDMMLAKEILGYQTTERKRIREMTRENIAKRTQLQKIEHEVKMAALMLDRAELDRSLAELEWEDAKVRLENRSLQSPISGNLIKIHRHPGEAVEKFETIYEVATLDKLWIEFDCPIPDEGRFEEGKKIWISRAVEPGDQRKATVINASKIANPSSQTFRIRLEIPNRNQVWKAGLKILIWGDKAATPGK